MNYRNLSQHSKFILEAYVEVCTTSVYICGIVYVCGVVYVCGIVYAIVYVHAIMYVCVASINDGISSGVCVFVMCRVSMHI